MDLEEKISASIERNLQEVIYAKSGVNAVNKIEAKHPKPYTFNFFYYASLALYNDSVSRIIKVLEKKDNNDTLSFWFLLKHNKDTVINFCNNNDIDINNFTIVSEKLKQLRDKLFFHIDKRGVKDKERIWKTAKIQGNEFNKSINDLLIILEHLYENKFKRKYNKFIYDGSDIVKIINACIETGTINDI